MHDYEVMSRINDLLGTLKDTYAELSTMHTRAALAAIQRSIQQKDEEMAWVDSCCMQLVCRQKNGKEETLTFQADHPAVKKEWVTELRLAQLALNANNTPAAWVQPHQRQQPILYGSGSGGSGHVNKADVVGGLGSETMQTELATATMSSKMPLFVRANSVSNKAHQQTEVSLVSMKYYVSKSHSQSALIIIHPLSIFKTGPMWLLLLH